MFKVYPFFETFVFKQISNHITAPAKSAYSLWALSFSMRGTMFSPDPVDLSKNTIQVLHLTGNEGWGVAEKVLGAIARIMLMVSGIKPAPDTITRILVQSHPPL